MYRLILTLAVATVITTPAPATTNEPGESPRTISLSTSEATEHTEDPEARMNALLEKYDTVIVELPDGQLHCKREVPLGTHIAQIVCKTPQQVTRERRQSELLKDEWNRLDRMGVLHSGRPY